MRLNANAVHNFLNLIGLVTGAFLVFDWEALGLSPHGAAMLAAWILLTDKIIKIVMNITRDGFTGLWQRQPPVEKP